MHATGSSSDRTSSSTSTGVDPVRSATSRWAASRSASASVRCSPCEACVRAGSPSSVSTSSSRCGPTVDTPRRTSSGRAAASAAASPLRRHGGSYSSPTCDRLAGKLVVRLGDHRSAPRDERRPGVTELFAGVGELHVPHVERRLDLVGRPSARLLEQRVALSNDAVELEAQRVVLDCKCNECVVEESSPLGRCALHDHEVVGREDADADGAEQIAGPGEVLPVDLHPIAPVGIDLGLDQRLALGPRREPSPGSPPRRRRRGPTHRPAPRACSSASPGTPGPRRGSSCPARCRRSPPSRPRSDRTWRPSSCGSRRAPAVRRSRLDHVTGRGRASTGTGSRRGRHRAAPPASSGRASTASPRRLRPPRRRRRGSRG